MQTEPTGNAPTVESGATEAAPKTAKKGKIAKVVHMGEREFKIVHLDTGDEAEFKKLVLPKDENDPHWDHRMTMEVPEKLIESMVERQLPTTIEVEESDDGRYFIDDGRTRVRAIPEVNRRRKKLGKPPFVLTIAVGKKREKSIEGDRETIESALQANIRLDDPPTVQAMHISRALAADVPEDKICRLMGMNGKRLHEYLGLLDLPKKAQAYVDDGTISIAGALALTKLDEKDVEAATEKLAAASKVGKKVGAKDVTPPKGDDKVATKKEIRQFIIDLQSDPLTGKSAKVAVQAFVMGVEICFGFRTVKQALAALTRLARGEDIKINYDQYKPD